MSSRPFRFIHAGDFHLERPLMGVAEVPDHLREVFLEAPFFAAKCVFDAALAEDADFLVLTGGIFNASEMGPRGPIFLGEQFVRLAERGIDVFWAGSMIDPPESWPAAVKLPQNVRFFPRGRAEGVLVQRDAVPLARVAGISCEANRQWRPDDFVPDPAGLFTVAVAHGEVEPDALRTRGINYWALGGRHDRSMPPSGDALVHYCGTTQGRCPEETGVHGCTLVQVDSQGQARTSLIPTDSVRWIGERITLDQSTSLDELEGRLRERMQVLRETMPAVVLLISWKIAGQGPLLDRLRRGKSANDLLERLRGDFGLGKPAAWSTALDVEPPDTLPPEWYEQETIRGDFLRAVRMFQMNGAEPLRLEEYLAPCDRDGQLAAAVTFPSEAARRKVLCEAAALGADLLTGEEPNA
ncbi:MAG: hypothetical protein GX594_02320 [Pirellulaceae bacterium]|nr:hypothetical protein [Pirellulaceae bacterium]